MDEKKSKKVKAPKKISKETVIFMSMGFLMFVIILAGFFCLRRFHWEFAQKMEKIRNEQTIVSNRDIRQEDLERVSEFFSEREKKYNESENIQVREAF